MIQPLINLLYRYPKAALEKMGKFGGYFSYRRMQYNRGRMEKAAYLLPSVHSRPGGLPVYFLTGKNYLYQTLFCINSLDKHSGGLFSYILVDDGSFNKAIIHRILKQLPGAVIITQDMILKNLEKTLPRTQFPVLWRKRREYPHIKKLTDVHTIPGDNWKLVLDSDMLFYEKPTAIMNWLENPGSPLHMVDCAESYGYPTAVMARLANASIPPLLNVGAIGLDSAAINWRQIEEWITALEETCGKSYYLEQALSAMLIAGKNSVILPAGEYIVNPAMPGNENTGVLHHYVDLSKKYYYNTAWKKVN